MSFFEDHDHYEVRPSARWANLQPASSKKDLHERATALCSLSYYSRYSIREELGSDYMYDKGFWDAHQYGFGYQDGTRLWLVFRGSDDFQDWILNLSSLPTFGIRPFPKRHVGFQQAWAALKPKVYALLDSNRHKYTKVSVAGHSLGGAVATLAAFDLAAKGHPISGVVTLGAPRAGGRRFVDAYNTTPNNLGQTLADVTDRLVTDGEIVDQVPPRQLGFRHVGGAAYLVPTGYSKEPQLLTGSSVSANLFNPPVLVALIISSLRRIGHHFRDVYADGLGDERTDPASETYRSIVSKALDGDPIVGGKLRKENERISEMVQSLSQTLKKNNSIPLGSFPLDPSFPKITFPAPQNPISRLRKPKGGFFRLHPRFLGQALLVLTIYLSVLWQAAWLIFTIPYGNGTASWAPYMEYTPYALFGSVCILMITILLRRIFGRGGKGENAKSPE